MTLEAPARRDRSLAYIALPSPDRLPEKDVESFHNRQINRLEKLDVGFKDRELSWSAGKHLFKPRNLTAWLGLDEERTRSMAIWVRPTIFDYAYEVLTMICGIAVEPVSR